VGILVAMIIHQFIRPLGLKSWKKIILSKRILSLMILVAVIRIYGAFVEAELPGGVLLVDMMRMELDSIGIPLIAIVVLIPFIAGMTSGLAIGFVGAAFPIVISILGPEPHMGILLATTLLAFTSGYMGMMLSPVHVCFVVTNEYFKTRLVNSLGGLLKPAFVVMIGAAGLYLLIRFVLFPGPGF
ncbi:MAG: DUF401 family protein, partial [Spirochaetales bacterium]|nr:DUF401 family protein [Spirochaetales bacterium]